MTKRLFPLLLATTAALASAQEGGHAHDENGQHIMGPGLSTTAPVNAGPVHVSPIVAANLDLRTIEADFAPLVTTFTVLGTVEPEPSRVAAVTSRVAGRITKLAIHDGSRVKAGGFLFELESRVVAHPAPVLTFTAPIDGVVLETHIVPGDAVEPDRVLVELIDLREVDVVARVPERQLAAIHVGQRALVRAPAFADASFEGAVKTTGARVDTATSTLPVFVHVANPTERLLPGMRTQIDFVTGESELAVVIPRAALLGEHGDWFVFRQTDTAGLTFERVSVELGLRNATQVEIIDGVLPGDRIVTQGHYELQFLSGDAPALEDDHGHSHGPGGHQH